MRIDSHQHYWQIGRNGHEWPTPDLTAIHRDFLPADLDAERIGTGVERTILVQAQPNDAETDWLLALADETPSIAAVVGWVDLLDPGAPERIAALYKNPKLKGLRPMLQNLAPEWILDPRLNPAIAAMAERGLVFDALIRPQHLAAITRFAGIWGDLRIVIDHAAKPDIAGAVREPWAREIAEIAELPNVVCKLSGLATEAGADWGDADMEFYVAHLLDCFGPGGLLWGSDWPVLRLAGSYAGWVACVERLLAGLTSDERDRIFGRNAKRIYGID